MTPRSRVPRDSLAGLLSVPTRHGLLVTNNPEKAQLAAGADDAGIGGLLGYVTPKPESDGTVVQSLDGAGNVVHEEATNAAMLPVAMARAQEMLPGDGRVQVTDALSVQGRRTELTEGEAMNLGGGGIDPQMLAMMMKMQGGQGGGGFGAQQPQQPPQLIQPQQQQPPVTANLGLPSMAQPQQFQQSPLVQNFGANMQGLQGQQQPSWWQRNQGNVQQGLWALANSGMF